jgi:hypothetical protein
MIEHSTKIPITICVGNNELEIVADVSFTIRAGSPETGPTYSSGGEPAEPAEIEYGEIEIEVTDHRVVGGKSILPAPQWLADFLCNSDDVYSQCGDASGWGEDDGSDPDEAYERMRDERDER